MQPGICATSFAPLLPGHRGSGRDGSRPQGGSSPPLRLGLGLLQARRIRRLRPPAGGGGGLFLPPSRQPGRQEVSAQPARCGEPGSWEQPQLDWRPAGGWGGQAGCAEGGARASGPSFVPRRPSFPSEVPLAHLGGGPAVPRLCASAPGARGLSGPGRGGDPPPRPGDPPPCPSRMRSGRGRQPLAGPACHCHCLPVCCLLGNLTRPR